jgi:hypothetical protein
VILRGEYSEGICYTITKQNPTGYTLTSIMVRVRQNNSNTMMLTLSKREKLLLYAPCSLLFTLCFALVW